MTATLGRTGDPTRYKVISVTHHWYIVGGLALLVIGYRGYRITRQGEGMLESSDFFLLLLGWVLLSGYFAAGGAAAVPSAVGTALLTLAGIAILGALLTSPIIGRERPR